VISGHRRLHACKKAGIKTVPALIYTIDRDAAAIALVDSNLQREKILPSEKAFAYKLKRDALSQSGQLDMDTIFHIMTQPKANQQEKISFKVSELRDYFPRHYAAAQMMQEIILAVKERQQRLQRQRNRDAR